MKENVKNEKIIDYIIDFFDEYKIEKKSVSKSLYHGSGKNETFTFNQYRHKNSDEWLDEFSFIRKITHTIFNSLVDEAFIKYKKNKEL